MSHVGPIPESPSDISPTWLTAVLREAGVLRKGTVSAVQWTLIGAEFGFTGIVVRLLPEYSDNARGEVLPTSLVAKLPMAEREIPSGYRADQERDPLIAQRYYERCAREVRFYQEIAPQSDAAIPHMVYGAADDETRRIVLLLEDLADARQGDLLQGCSPSDAAHVVEAVAPLHAQWWGKRSTSSLPWLPHWGSNHADRVAQYAQNVDPFLNRFGDHLPSEIRKVVTSLPSHLADVFAHLTATPWTVIHTDLHLDNVCFCPATARNPAVVLDWQSVSWGPAALDLSYFLVGALTPEDRHLAEMDILQQYHARLTERGVTGYSLERLISDYQVALLIQLGGTAIYMANAIREERTGRELALMDAALGDGRLIAALLDHDVANILTKL